MIIHGFSKNIEVANELIKNGFYLSFGKYLLLNSELELVNGIATNEGDQDTLEELLTISDEELKFWSDRGVPNDYMIKDRLEEEIHV